MSPFVRQFRDFFVSLKLTVVLLALSIVLIFWATLAQVKLGIWGVQEKFFHTLFVLETIPGTTIPLPVFPGGYFLGGLLLINLVAAHIYRFKLEWKKAGIQLTHLGLILLGLLGELLTSLLQVESNMRIEEGSTQHYSESYRLNELAIVDTTSPDFNEVVTIPEAVLADGGVIQHPKLPFQVRIRDYYPNAALEMREQAANATPAIATAGIGPRVAVTPLRLTYQQDERNAPAANIEFVGPEGSLGTWLVSPLLGMPQKFDYAGRTWEIGLRFKRYYHPFTLTLLDFTHEKYAGTDIPKNFASRIRLKTDDARQDREVLIYMNNPLRHAGLTFYQASFEKGDRVSILQVVRNPGWVLPYISCIMMGLGLLVQFGIHLVGFVRKRAAAAGVASSGRPSHSASASLPALAPQPATSGLGRWLPLIVLTFAAVWLVSSLRPQKNTSEMDLVAFGRLPVLVNGRIKPLDTVARTSLLMLQGRQRVYETGVGNLVETPTEWLADVLFQPAKADTYPTFRLSATDSPELLTLMGLTEADIKIEHKSAILRVLALADFVPSTRTRFSYNQLLPKLAELDRQAQLAEPIEAQLRTPFQKAVMQLRERVLLYQRLKHSVQLPDSSGFLTEITQFQQNLAAGVASVRARQKGEAHDEAAFKTMLAAAQRFDAMAQLGYLLTIPPVASDTNPTAWSSAGQALLETFETGAINPNVMAYAALGSAWRARQVGQFNEIVRLFRDQLAKRFGPQLDKSDIEVRFNAAEPFYKSMQLYAVAFLLAIFSWLKWPQVLGRSAFYLTLLAFVAATAGIATRMWLEGRPPVTNLYSSALFVGWGSVGLCLILERIYRNGIGSAAAGTIGFVTLLIAHHLSLDGDTLEMMRAVLDTNLWLATHVVIVTIGYAATFLAGFLALIYIFRGVLTRSLNKDTADALTRMVYGIVCFATLCSLIGTVLGGIWADQSWGRFWGWDPKENGAVMIVLWNAVILHARWGGLVKQRGLMCLAIVGNVITSWSWFGTNMLGVGLHSYGFMDAAFYWLLTFVFAQVAIILLAQLPLEKWRSFKTV